MVFTLKCQTIIRDHQPRLLGNFEEVYQFQKIRENKTGEKSSEQESPRKISESYWDTSILNKLYLFSKKHEENLFAQKHDENLEISWEDIRLEADYNIQEDASSGIKQLQKDLAEQLRLDLAENNLNEDHEKNDA